MDGVLRYRMKCGGEITGFEQVTKPYGLWYGAVKVFNDSCESPCLVFSHSDRLCPNPSSLEQQT